MAIREGVFPVLNTATLLALVVDLAVEVAMGDASSVGHRADRAHGGSGLCRACVVAEFDNVRHAVVTRLGDEDAYLALFSTHMPVDPNRGMMPSGLTDLGMVRWAFGRSGEEAENVRG